MSAEMINNHKKVVFLDVDGTMVNDRGEIPESTKEAVRRASSSARVSGVPQPEGQGRGKSIITRSKSSARRSAP